MLLKLEIKYPASQYPQAHELFEQAFSGNEPDTIFIRRSAAENKQFITAFVVALLWLAGWFIFNLIFNPGEYFNLLVIVFGCGGTLALFHVIQCKSFEGFFDQS